MDRLYAFKHKNSLFTSVSLSSIKQHVNLVSFSEENRHLTTFNVEFYAVSFIGVNYVEEGGGFYFCDVTRMCKGDGENRVITCTRTSMLPATQQDQTHYKSVVEKSWSTF